MTQGSENELQRLLKEAFPRADREMQRDLWPVMLRRLEAPRIELPWFDWALIAALGIWAVFYPGGVLELLYHL